MTDIRIDVTDERDYNVCPENLNGVHGPVTQHFDPELPEGFAGVACNACGTTTGIPIPPAEEISW